MADFIPIRTTANNLINIPIVDGQIVAVYDTGEIYIDKGNIRQRYSDIYFGTYAEIIGLLAPLTGKLYFATDTYQLLQVYKSGSRYIWRVLNSNSESGDRDTLLNRSNCIDDGVNALSIGNSNIASGDFSLAAGYLSKTETDSSFAFGQGCLNKFHSIATNYKPDSNIDIVAGSAKLSRTISNLEAHYGSAELMDFSRILFTGLLSVQAIFMIEHNYSLRAIKICQIIVIEKNEIKHTEPVYPWDSSEYAWAYYDYPDLYNIMDYYAPLLYIRGRKLKNVPAYPVRYAQIGIDYTYMIDNYDNGYYDYY